MAIQLGTTNRWIKSSHSANGACVEVRSSVPHTVDVRDSKAPDGPRLSFGPDSWAGFVGAMRKGREGSAHA
ncbi:DUF397 domain-containing protein [Streptomyces sp. ODS28]|uniref:DUF397 domain-containing protein n=1 Tax=Streptomyces sp. ODS28 TaxID=3136688 RepID=UPI0031EB7299